MANPFLFIGKIKSLNTLWCAFVTCSINDFILRYIAAAYSFPNFNTIFSITKGMLFMP